MAGGDPRYNQTAVGAQKVKKVGRGGRGKKSRSKSSHDDPSVIARSMAKIHLEEANGQYKTGLFSKGMRSYDLALELQPEDVEALVSRSRCHLAIGQPANALKDAEAALAIDPGYIRGIYQKAEALYHLGYFEHSLMFYHRGYRTRPEMECFRLGIQKAQEAIQNTIGKSPKPKKPEFSRLISNGNTVAPPKPAICRKADLKKNNRTSSAYQESSGSSSRSSRQLLGELCIDKLYLQNLLQHPDIKAPHQEGCKHISGPAEEAVSYLHGREKFWRQQTVNGQPHHPLLSNTKKSLVLQSMKR